MDRPIPAFYCVYLLRAGSRSLYVGSTPDPRRRLAQHNGELKGGAFKTKRMQHRWEMVCIVTGFPSQVAALQFEWAFQKPHITLKIPATERAPPKTTNHTNRKGTPQKRRVKPTHTISERVSTLHLLLRVNPFSRWPLAVRFFAEDVWKVWNKYVKRMMEDEDCRIRSSMDIRLDLNDDFGPENGKNVAKTRKKKDEEEEDDEENDEDLDITDTKKSRSKWAPKPGGGLQGLDCSYAPLLPVLQKTSELLPTTPSSSPLPCRICHLPLTSDPPHPTTAVCPHALCSTTTHLTCLASHFLAQEAQDRGNIYLNGLNSTIEKIPIETQVVPVAGRCPGCERTTMWIDIVKPLSYRVKSCGASKRKISAVGRMGKGKTNGGDGDEDDGENSPREEEGVEQEEDEGATRFKKPRRKAPPKSRRGAGAVTSTRNRNSGSDDEDIPLSMLSTSKPKAATKPKTKPEPKPRKPKTKKATKALQENTDGEEEEEKEKQAKPKKPIRKGKPSTCTSNITVLEIPDSEDDYEEILSSSSDEPLPHTSKPLKPSGAKSAVSRRKVSPATTTTTTKVKGKGKASTSTTTSKSPKKRAGKNKKATIIPNIPNGDNDPAEEGEEQEDDVIMRSSGLDSLQSGSDDDDDEASDAEESFIQRSMMRGDDGNDDFEQWIWHDRLDEYDDEGRQVLG
ncbi:hypothetical protein DFH27DRAFT_260645 [Peziza echinospora]|nr:hypothetical protein DFH27DRAFT_260645 [Peziza echinospora]